MAQKIDPGKRLDIDMYAEADKVRGVKKLPTYLIDAIRLFDKSKSLRQILGDPLVDAYTVIKQREWDDYSRNLSDWERQNTLDT